MTTALADVERPRTTHAERVYAPRLDLYVGDDALLVRADLPGVSQDGLTIEYESGKLRLEGRRSDTIVYRRVMGVPEGIDPDGITAELRHGVLTLRLPRAAATKPRRIAVSG